MISQYTDERLNYLNHNKDNGECYHCDHIREDKQKMNYDEEFNMVGFSDLFSGFKHWYDVAGNKLKSFVKGPTKAIGANIGGSNTTN